MRGSDRLNSQGRPLSPDSLTRTVSRLQTRDLVMVHQGIKFSKEFSLKQVQRRWHALLYEENVGRYSRV